jgi:hypothetical protein
LRFADTIITLKSKLAQEVTPKTAKTIFSANAIGPVINQDGDPSEN